MRRSICFLAIAATSLLLSTAGCSSADSDAGLPEVNEKNCDSDLASKIPNPAQRNKFIDRCARLNTFKPSKPRAW